MGHKHPPAAINIVCPESASAQHSLERSVSVVRLSASRLVMPISLQENHCQQGQGEQELSLGEPLPARPRWTRMLTVLIGP